MMVVRSTSTLLFTFATAHVAGSLRQLIDAFINIPANAPPLYSTLYWSSETDGITVMKTILYVTSVFLQNSVIIWRLYIIWNSNWKVVVIPIIVELAQMGIAYAAAILLATGVDIDSPIIVHIGPIRWSLDLAVNVCVTAAIAGRLWYMDRKVVRLGSSRYIASILTVIESGTIFATATPVMLVLYVRGNPLALNGIDISAQLAALTPMLITAWVGFGVTHGIPGYKSGMGISGLLSDAEGGGPHMHHGSYELSCVHLPGRHTNSGTVLASTNAGAIAEDGCTRACAGKPNALSEAV